MELIGFFISIVLLIYLFMALFTPERCSCYCFWPQ